MAPNHYDKITQNKVEALLYPRITSRMNVPWVTKVTDSPIFCDKTENTNTSLFM